MGAEAVREIISRMDLEELSRSLHVEVRTSSGQRRKKAIKRLRLIEAFRRSGTRPDWMILSVLPVIPPDLRPMVQLDGGRFATSDLNDLYRRVINRNNRLKRLLELGAPEIIIRNEKRMLQEACDALIDNGRRGRAIAGTGNHRLKSLSDMLKGKQGRFRQNLLGKRVDYSGRSVIVVGPELKLHQCGLPKKMALELFKPFVMRQLVEKGFAHNIKSAKRIVERVRPEVWDVLEEVIKDHPVLLNRAPTLHRLGIQAFMPVLVEGSAIQIHPLVCTAFNADFDGDQMAVHVPLSTAAQEEARTMMLSTANLLSPADGSPVVAPTQDMVLGCYYLTMDPLGKQPKRVRIFATEDEAILSYQLREKTGVTLHEPVEAEVQTWNAETESLELKRVRTTVGRIIFNQILPDPMRYKDEVMKRSDLKDLVDECYRLLGPDETAHLVDGIKSVGFDFATRGGMTIGLFDIEVPKDKQARLAAADDSVNEIDRQFQRGLITEDERYEQVVDVWQKTTSAMSDEMMKGLKADGPVTMMTASGARGNKGNIGQLGAMRGLMADPSGRIIDVPVRSNFREGMTVLEYFISTHGARKGLADTALRTADSGYLTRRLVDVAQDVITRDDDCGTEEGSWITREDSTDEKEFRRRLVGRLAAAPLPDTSVKVKKGEEQPLVVDRNIEITEEIAARIEAAGIQEVLVRSPLDLRSALRRLPGVLRPQPRDRRHGRLRRGGRDHRRPVDRRAGHPAHDADVPYRRRRRPRHHRRPAARRGALRGPRPQGQGRDQPHRRDRRDPSERHRDEGQGRRARRSTTRRSGCPRAPSCWPQPATRSRPTRSSPGSPTATPARRPTSSRRSRASSSRATTASPSGPRTSSSASTRSPTTPSCWSRTARRSGPATASRTARSTRRSTSRPGARTPSSATWSRKSRRSTGARASRSTTSTSRSSSGRCSGRSGSTSRATSTCSRRS